MNQEFENRLTTIAAEFRENCKYYSEILSIHHTDADGISSGAIIKSLLSSMGLPFRQIANNLDQPWENFLDTINAQIKPKSAIIFSDCAPSAIILHKMLQDKPDVHFYILDHHVFQHDPTQSLSESIYNANPTEFGLNGLKDIAGATLNYLFTKAVDPIYSRHVWFAAIGMGGDTLEHFDNYRSYNQQVILEAAELNQIELKKGLCAYGSMHERLDKVLAHSILPYIPKCEGNPAKAKEILVSLNIDFRKKVEELTEIEIEAIAAALHPTLKGTYITFPKKTGVFHYSFEHAQLISLIGHDNPLLALKLIEERAPSSELKEKYRDFIEKLAKYLTIFMNIPKVETQHALVVDVSGHIPLPLWSDISSFSTINKIYPIHKVLIFGGVDKGSMKVSIRATKEFIESHKGIGANIVAKRLAERIGGSGGGHDLAAGLRFPPEQFSTLCKTVDEIF